MIQCHEWDAPLLHLPLLPHLDRMLRWSHHQWPQSQWEHLEKGQKTLRCDFGKVCPAGFCSYNISQWSPVFKVSLCLIVVQVVVLMQSRHTNVWSRHSDSQIIPHMFSRSWFKIVWFRGASSWSSSSSRFTPAMTASMSLSHPWSDSSLTAAMRVVMGVKDRWRWAWWSAADLAQLCWDGSRMWVHRL